jgi:hypothetical protein
VVTGTPVDRLAERLSALEQFKDSTVIGFGGQLDVERTKYALLSHHLRVPDPLYVIGEHGPRVIPVYAGEQSYDLIRQEAGSTLKRISVSGKPRNLATGIQLSRLASALAGNTNVLCLSTPDKDFDGLSITWPYRANESGLMEKVALPHIGFLASKLLDDLLQFRRTEHES